jgi:hypothetical protein
LGKVEAFNTNFSDVDSVTRLEHFGALKPYGPDGVLLSLKVSRWKTGRLDYFLTLNLKTLKDRFRATNLSGVASFRVLEF